MTEDLPDLSAIPKIESQETPRQLIDVDIYKELYHILILYYGDDVHMKESLKTCEFLPVNYSSRVNFSIPKSCYEACIIALKTIEQSAAKDLSLRSKKVLDALGTV
ncbi:hypothetical protein COW46_00160 [Candidatus Gracilibacteria bacterium CG17_big_fil_post_rev_8_21_14_2_50_48_13]|nr:MAG: hypothetical protein COW46_00160 [Candidatus Gracilibacteria bacterium CG17_big_fil_post_rev_8_21_14_2_50_48_13]